MSQLSAYLLHNSLQRFEIILLVVNDLWPHFLLFGCNSVCTCRNSQRTISATVWSELSDVTARILWLLTDRAPWVISGLGVKVEELISADASVTWATLIVPMFSSSCWSYIIISSYLAFSLSSSSFFSSSSSSTSSANTYKKKYHEAAFFLSLDTWKRIHVKFNTASPPAAAIRPRLGGRREKWLAVRGGWGGWRWGAVGARSRWGEGWQVNLSFPDTVQTRREHEHYSTVCCRRGNFAVLGIQSQDEVK